VPNARHMARLIALVPAGFAIGSLLEWLVARRAPTALHRDFAQPLAVATAWHSTGLWVLAALFVGVAIAAIGYFAAVRMLLASELSRPRSSLFVLATACALGVVAAFFAPILLSSDVYAYAAYGEMALRGIDPYAHARLATGDPIFSATIWQWSNPAPVCVYGPLFVAIAQGVVRLTAFAGVAGQLDALRLVAMIALVACVPLSYFAFAPLGARVRIVAAATIALNPIAIWSSAEGHNDALMLALALAGFALVRRFGPGIGVAIVIFSASIKAPSAIAAAAFALAQRGRDAWVTWTGLFASSALLVWWCLPAALEIASSVHGGHALPQISLWEVGALSPIAIAGLLLVVGIRALVRGEVDGWIYLALGLWCALPNPYPWYGLWFLPIAALAPQSRAAAVAVALSLTTALRYLPDVYGTLPMGIGIGLSILAFTPLLALLRPNSATLTNLV
jgi:hypothetical protein